MKFFIVTSLLLSSLTSFAQNSGTGPGNTKLSNSSKRLVATCQEVGVQKVLAQAAARDLDVRAEDVSECGVDNRPLNLAAKYVWFCAEASNGEVVQVLTQKPTFGECF